ncbi:MAG TPA: YdcF family protein [Rhodopila sp.]|uniref:YdcF family protein n=1 Tax=Rhodopila sp. TaxID=2480087 RepID=UPI002B5E14AD|nr:YdcF family protein [Rhodopila sp.]HVY17217.1 YdcF family protein [Rhodopila sp.]
MRRLAMRRLGWIAKRLLAIAAVAAAGGFAWFAHMTAQPAPPLPAYVDGIVALTGGPGRVEAALHLLAQGRAHRLLITGIGGGTDLAVLGHVAGMDLAPLASRITLGRYAASTRGNGVETAAWARENKILTLAVVTAGYHMPRALLELRSALPGVRLYPLPVQPTEQGLAVWGPRLKLDLEEYAKYLFTLSGLSVWLPRRESGQVPPAHPTSAHPGPAHPKAAG